MATNKGSIWATKGSTGRNTGSGGYVDVKSGRTVDASPMSKADVQRVSRAMEKAGKATGAFQSKSK